MLQRADLLLYFSGDLRVAMPTVHNGNAGEAVEVSVPFTVKEILHLTADDLARRFVEMTQTGHDVFLFLFKNGFRSNIRFRLFPHGKTPFKNIPKI